MHEALLFRGSLAILAVLLATGCGGSSSPPGGAKQGAEAGRSHSREQALEITARMLEAYQNARTYADRGAYAEEAVFRGEGIARELPYYELSAALARPNRVRLVFAEAVAANNAERESFEVACDGELLRATSTEFPDQMVERMAPGGLTVQNVLGDAAIRQKLAGRELADVFPQLAMLLNADGAAVFPNDSNPRLLTDETLDGRGCYRVATSHPEGTRVLWIDKQSYLLRRMELPSEATRRATDPEGIYLRFSVRIDFEDVMVDAEIDETSFTLQPESGVRRVRRFVRAEGVEKNDQ